MHLPLILYEPKAYHDKLRASDTVSSLYTEAIYCNAKALGDYSLSGIRRSSATRGSLMYMISVPEVASTIENESAIGGGLL